MKHYSVVEVSITDPAWIDPYVANVTKLVTDRGGKYLARTMSVTQLEGEGSAPQVVVLLEWPSKEAADDFYSSDDYKPFLESRLAGATNRNILFSAEDISG